MNLVLTQDERQFQTQVRTFFEQDYPREILDKVKQGYRLTRADHVVSQQALQAKGWFASSWSKEFGGTGWTPIERYLFDQELERVGAPNLIPMAVIYIGPVIIAFGTSEQQQRWLPDILSSKSMWAQGYSEPEAGSDLASLALKATFVSDAEGEHYVLNGTKVWTTLAQWADWIFCLVRTSREDYKQAGISFICVDMHANGISVEPIVSMNGSRELNRVIFDNVRVPVSNRIGEEGRGWYYANVLLENERLSYAHIARKQEDVKKLKQLAAATSSNTVGVTMLQDPLFRHRLAALEIEIASLEITVLRALTNESHTATISILKIRCTECAQHITELFVDLLALNATPYPDREKANWQANLTVSDINGPIWSDAYLFERAQTIYGGTTEIQKNIAWKAIAK